MKEGYTVEASVIHNARLVWATSKLWAIYSLRPPIHTLQAPEYYLIPLNISLFVYVL